MQNYINVDPVVPGVLHESDSLLFSSISFHDRDDLETSSGRTYPDTAGRTGSTTAGNFSGINPLMKAPSAAMSSIFTPPMNSESAAPVSSTALNNIADGHSMNPLQQSPTQPALSPGGMMVQPVSIVSGDQRSTDKARKSLKEPKTMRYK